MNTHRPLYNPKNTYPYNVWDHYLNTSMLEYIDRAHLRSNDLKILALLEPHAPHTFDIEFKELKTDWQNTQVDIIHMADGSYGFEKKYFDEKDNFRHLDPDRHFFPLFWLYQTFYWLQDPNEWVGRTRYTPFRHFTIYCRNPRIHRVVILNELWKKNILQSNYYSYLNNDTVYRLEPEEFDYDFDNIEVPPKEVDFNYENYTTKSWVNSFKSEAFTNTAFQIIVESSFSLICLTEKIFSCILAKKPFIAFGSPQLNSALSKFGFRLYYNIFDYSFEQETDFFKRIYAFTDEIERVCRTHVPIDIHEKLKPVAYHNYCVALYILKHKKFVCEKFLEWDKSFNVHEYWKNHTAQWFYYDEKNIDKYYNEEKEYIENFVSNLL